ncbi:hypothetical protein I3842_03G158600 [Carya illinoinensis]|uniref:Uncharacterized protein n=1 Tax=Carya illinoinensis TaxID=32201 RepID=A0A922FLC5_CARIL|nr:hypothetical protein I3842_03G158600 [Carya illinoinensis]
MGDPTETATKNFPSPPICRTPPQSHVLHLQARRQIHLSCSSPLMSSSESLSQLIQLSLGELSFYVCYG